MSAHLLDRVGRRQCVGRADPLGHLGGDHVGGHPHADPDHSAIQEGRVSSCYAGGCRWCRSSWRNAGELMWRRPMVINPGVVDVAVLEPIPTDGWSVEDHDTRIAEVRQGIVDTLDDWPTSEEVS
jgi:hypothetical protein